MDYPSSGHDDLMPQAEPTVAELLHASSPSDLDEASQDAQVAAARELESRLRGQVAALTLSSDLTSALSKLDPTMPSALWSLYEPEQVAAFQELEAASGIEAILANTRTPVADLLADGAARQLYDLGLRAMELASRRSAPYCLGVANLDRWDTADPIAAFTGTLRLLEGVCDGGAQGLLLEQAPSLDLACTLLDALAEKRTHLPAVICCFDPTASGVAPQLTPQTDERGFALLGMPPTAQRPDYARLVESLASRSVAAWGFSMQTAEDLVRCQGLFRGDGSQGAAYMLSAALLETGAADHLMFDAATTAVGLIGPAKLSLVSRLVLAQQQVDRPEDQR